jgi:hypothetical protein
MRIAAKSASPVQSEALQVAIAAHRSAQNKIDAMPGDSDEFATAVSDAEALLWEVAEAPCANDADFFVKASYLIGDAHRELGGMFFA